MWALTSVRFLIGCALILGSAYVLLLTGATIIGSTDKLWIPFVISIVTEVIGWIMALKGAAK